MPKKNIPSAKKFHFYTKFWTEEVDSVLITKLLDLSYSDVRFPKEPTRLVLDDIVEDVNANCNRTFHRSKCLMQFNKLRSRYDTFELILMHEGVTWDKSNNFVIAKEGMWDTVCKLFPIADSYRQEGEREWDSLKQIFGVRNDQPLRNDREVILISSDDETHFKDKTIASDDDSVGSPIVTKKVIQKQFQGVGTSYNRDDDLKTAKKFDLNIIPTDSGDQVSSTASCSPFKFPKA